MDLPAWPQGGFAYYINYDYEVLPTLREQQEEFTPEPLELGLALGLLVTIVIIFLG